MAADRGVVRRHIAGPTGHNAGDYCQGAGSDGGKTDFYDKAEAIGEFVQKQVRYFAVEVGIGGYQPHPAGEILQHMYGDCKDKATLVSAMLSSVGIHSALMMVDSRRGVVDPKAPSLVGNHMIAAIKFPLGIALLNCTA